MTAELVRRRGADWVHLRSPKDTAATFAHTLCGLAFTNTQVAAHPGEEITCPSCVQKDTLARRMELIAEAPMTFKPKVAGTAAAWTGPHVEVLVDVDPDGGTQVMGVYLDGQEVPYSHLVSYVVDPGAGNERGLWDEETEAVTGDVTMTPDFRDAVVATRNQALAADRGRYITREDW